MTQQDTNTLQRKITYLSKDGELYEINERNIGELHKSHFKPLVNI